MNQEKMSFARGPWLLAITLFAACLALFTRENRFPFDYHPDEDGKTYQIIHRERNFHHPLLLLNATDLAVHLAGVPKHDQAVVVAGRWVSAAFAAGAVALLAAAVWLRAGWLAGASVGMLAGTHAKLIEAAHYLKEDTALVFGIALFFLAVEMFARSPGTWTLRFVGIASAVAASGKYVGILAFLFALPLVWRAREPALEQRWRTFLCAFAFAFVALNLPPTFHISSPFKSLKREVTGVTVGHRGLKREVPHAKYFPELIEDVPAPVLAFAGVCILALATTARRRTGAEWTFALFPIVYFALISFSPKTGGRYLLPASTVLCALGGLGVVEVARGVSRGKSALIANAVIACGTAYLLGSQLPRLHEEMHHFRQDDRVALAAWIREQVPAEAIIVEDHRVNLLAHRARAGLPQRIFDNDYAADLGTLDEMRGWGRVYVAVSPRAYDRFFSKSLKPRESERADFERRREFYKRLFAEGRLVWEAKSRGNIYLQPGLKLYELQN